MTKHCRSCKFWKANKGDSRNDDWKANHNCSVTHTGSAGRMEDVGAQKIYERSITKNHIRYLKYRGDGDSKAYADVVESDPYNGLSTEKRECVGPVHKRVCAVYGN